MSSPMWWALSIWIFLIPEISFDVSFTMSSVSVHDLFSYSAIPSNLKLSCLERFSWAIILLISLFPHHVFFALFHVYSFLYFSYSIKSKHSVKIFSVEAHNQLRFEIDENLFSLIFETQIQIQIHIHFKSLPIATYYLTTIHIKNLYLH